MTWYKDSGLELRKSQNKLLRREMSVATVWTIRKHTLCLVGSSGGYVSESVIKHLDVNHNTPV